MGNISHNFPSLPVRQTQAGQEMLSALSAGPQQLPLALVPTAVLLIRAVGAVVDAVAVFAGWDAGAIGALEAVTFLL